MMMPEQNEKVRERNEQLAAESEYPRSEQTPTGQAATGQTATEQTATEQTATEQTATEQAGATEARPEQMRPEQSPSGQMQSGQMQSGQTQSGQQTASAEHERHERLLPEDHAAAYGSRWDAVKGTFVDEPREAVAQADALVGELLEELETLFREQRRSIEQGLDTDETSTEDLRLALRRYRSFFERLLAV
jgi:hypothetical protein